MPYLTETDFNAPSGELNRAMTKLYLTCNEYSHLTMRLIDLVQKYEHDQKPRYATFNDIIGALECSVMEFERRRTKTSLAALQVREVVKHVKDQYYKAVVAPYEDKKIAEHGDIYAKA